MHRSTLQKAVSFDLLDILMTLRPVHEERDGAGSALSASRHFFAGALIFTVSAVLPSAIIFTATR